MVITDVSDGLEGFYKSAVRCFSCARPLEDKAKVWWSGHALDGSEAGCWLALHAGCAAKLALHLASDALKADLKNDRHDLNHGSPLLPD